MKNTPLTLVIMDGWGVSKPSDGNAISKAELPVFTSLLKQYPSTVLNTCGEAVGLPKGVMGNSEVGHENIGGGRIVIQKLTLISDSVRDGSFFKNNVLLNAINHVQKNKSKLHIMGLISEGDVHSHLGHLYALFDLAKRNNVKDVYLHAITDGRDDPPTSGVDLIKKVENKIKDFNGKIATVCGRFYAMDRDNRWQRVKKYYDLVTKGIGYTEKSAELAIKSGYKRGENKDSYDKDTPAEVSDEFILPTLITDKSNLISDNDAVIFFNFRPDRAREITTALTQINFKEFEREIFPKNLYYACLTEYDSSLHSKDTANPVVPTAFTKNELKEVNKSNSIGEIISNLKKKQVRIAETEKFRHVTSFFNMGREKEFEGEDRILIPSPKVTTYDLKPEMSAPEVSEKTISSIKSKEYSLIVVNFANADMVGHTGIIPSAVKAVEAVDKCLGDILQATFSVNGTLIVTADHGNADQMINDDGSIRTAHSLNPVPFILINNELKNIKLKVSGKLADIAPTLLEVMGVEKPKEMNGESLIDRGNSENHKKDLAESAK